MGVLEPLDEKTSDMIENSEWIPQTINRTLKNLSKSRDAILYNQDYIEPDSVFMLLHSKDVSDIDTEKELEKEVELLSGFRESVQNARKMNSCVNDYVEKADIEPDYDNPIESWEELGELKDKLDRLPNTVRQKIWGSSDIEDIGHKKFDIEYTKRLFQSVDSFDALPVIEGVVEAQELIEDERERLMEHALGEHQRRDTSYDRPEIPTEPID